MTVRRPVDRKRAAGRDLAEESLRRVVVDGVEPQVDGGLFPIKRVVGETVVVEADAFADGHDRIVCLLRHGRADAAERREVEMRPLGNDRWRGEFRVTAEGKHAYGIEAWVDAWRSWQRDLRKRLEAGQEDLSVDLRIGADLVRAAAERAPAEDGRRLRELASRVETDADAALEDELAALMTRYPDRTHATRFPRELLVVVDRERARFSSWYEVFPRSAGTEPGHGSLRDVEARILPYVADLGFDVLYLPPIHPIGRTKRKGPNNAVRAGPSDPGSPWAIGAAEGGHKAIHPDLGTIEDFRSLVAAASDAGVEVALDIALQCSADHPYVKEHPEWFRRRPDGTVRYAENPPKKYEDIYPFDFSCERWRELWEELLSIFRHWTGEGVRIFRVDNPHTKPFAFWEWCIAEIKREHPDVLFLAEAFTRPKVMYRLAKLGFTQSYTYFAWRNASWELREYFTELTGTGVREFLRPNLWPNTPDILSEYLQTGGRPAFLVRLLLAGTLGASYGIYGPAFELCEAEAREPGSEEYRDSEKYEVRRRDLASEESLSDVVRRLNRIRHENPALQADEGLRFHDVDNEMLLCFSKRSGENLVVVVANLDPHHTHSGWMSLDFADLGLEQGKPIQVHDLLSDARYLWQEGRNYVELDPRVMPAHIFRVRRKVRTEHDFDYYL
jgi:starch synthase (maltosyl-transferring)